MVELAFVDNDYNEIQVHHLDMTIEEALRILPKLEYRVGKDGLHYDKTGPIIVDLKRKTIEIEVNYGED